MPEWILSGLIVLTYVIGLLGLLVYLWMSRDA